MPLRHGPVSRTRAKVAASAGPAHRGVGVGEPVQDDPRGCLARNQRCLRPSSRERRRASERNIWKDGREPWPCSRERRRASERNIWKDGVLAVLRERCRRGTPGQSTTLTGAAGMMDDGSVFRSFSAAMVLFIKFVPVEQDAE